MQEATGYPDDIQGLGGVNCRHRMFAFIPGISKPNPIKYCDTEENERIYKATQEQRLKERQIRKLKKEIAAIKPLGDKDVTKALQIKLKNRQAELQTHCDKYGLKRDYSRELVQEQVAKPPLTKSAKNGNINNTTQTKIVSGQSTSPMDETLYNKMKKGLEKNGIIVMEAKGDDLKFLNALGAEASYSNGYIMHIGKIPSASAMFEETIHAQQAKTYGELNTSMPTELYAREIAANRMLKRNHKAYGFTNDDLNEITANLTLWEKRFEKEVGVKYDESEYHRGI